MRLLRPLGFVLGLVAALAVLAGRRVVTRQVEAALERAPAAADDVGIAPSASPGQRLARRVAAALGLAVLALGLWKLVHAVQPASYGWLALWLLGAVLLHDVVIAPVLVALRFTAHRRFLRLPPAALGILTGAFVVVGVLALVVAPEIWAQHLGPANPTVLPGPYGQRLLATVAVVAGASLVAVAVVVLRARQGVVPGAPATRPARTG